MQFISFFLVEKTFENVCNLEKIYMVHGSDAITISEKLIGVIAPLVNEDNADCCIEQRKSNLPK